MLQQKLTPLQALQKIKHYCAYQERCHYETQTKLYSMGLNKQEVDAHICTLIEENYLNEERFANLFAGSKFRHKHWGKVKIKQALQLKRVSSYLINNALQQIDDTDYLQTLHTVAEKKWQDLASSVRGEKYATAIVKMKTMQYLLQKGFELNLIKPILVAIETSAHQ